VYATAPPATHKRRFTCSAACHAPSHSGPPSLYHMCNVDPRLVGYSAGHDCHFIPPCSVRGCNDQLSCEVRQASVVFGETAPVLVPAP